MFYIIWQTSKVNCNNSILLIDENGGNTELKRCDIPTILDGISPQTIYTNMQLNKEWSIFNIVYLKLTEFESNYLFELLAIGPIKMDREIPNSFLVFFKRLEYRRHILHSAVENCVEKASFPLDSYDYTVRWLSRSDVRIYPTGDLMDRQVFCTRWSGSHWSEFLEIGYIESAPKRDPKTLKGLRTDATRFRFIHSPAFLLVKFEKLNAPVDYPVGLPVWITNIELSALVQCDPKAKFSIEDCLQCETTDFPSEMTQLTADLTLQLSPSTGLATRIVLGGFDCTWTSALWHAIERARWLMLAKHIQTHFPFTLSGYGDGAMSFYCWTGDMAQICEILKVRAAVLKQSDKEFDAQLRNDISNIVYTRYENEHEHEHEKNNHQLTGI
jgi:hypothetical protein